MTIMRTVPNRWSNRPAETRDFFVKLLGFEVAMDIGWAVTVASPSNTSAQVTIVGNDDMAAPGISVEVADVDAVKPRPSSRDSRSSTCPRRGVGSPAIHAPRAEWHDCQRPVAPLRLSAPLVSSAREGRVRGGRHPSHYIRRLDPGRRRPAPSADPAVARVELVRLAVSHGAADVEPVGAVGVPRGVAASAPAAVAVVVEANEWLRVVQR